MKLKIKISPRGIGYLLSKKFTDQGAFYSELKIKDCERFHTEDYSFCDDCDGFREFLTKYRNKYDEYIKVNNLIECEIEVMSCKSFIKILEILSQYLFLRMSKQAERNLDIRESESNLMIVKNMLTTMSQEGCIGITLSELYVETLKSTSDLGALINIQSDKFIKDINDNFISVKEIEFQKIKFNFLFKQETKKPTDMLPTVMFNGSNIIAVNVNIPENVLLELAPPKQS